jgi:hypothetical protein
VGAWRELALSIEKEDFLLFTDALGDINYELDFGVLEVLYRAHPDLRPSGMVPVTPLGAGCPVRASKQSADGDEEKTGNG